MTTEPASPQTVAAELARHITATVGDVKEWTLTVRTITGRQVVIFPPEQDPGLTYELHLDAAHALSCPGCNACRVVRSA